MTLFRRCATLLALLLPLAAVGAAEAPVVPLEPGAILGRWIGPAPERARRDLSGMAVAEPLWRDGRPAARLWLLDDKGADLAQSLLGALVRLPPGRADTTLRPMGTLSPVTVLNPRQLPVGEDFEDLAFLPGDGDHPGMVAIVGERGPRERGVSWLYLMREVRGSLELVYSADASPPDEPVSNDGLEGVALTKLGGDTVAVLTFKERPAPCYVRSWLFRRGPGGRLMPLGAPRMDHLEGVTTQSGATFDPTGRLWVIDRSANRLAVVERSVLLRALADSADSPIPVSRQVDFNALEPALENKIGSETPLSPFGAAEAIAFDPAGRLYLLSDNNEAGGSVLILLEAFDQPRR